MHAWVYYGVCVHTCVFVYVCGQQKGARCDGLNEKAKSKETKSRVIRECLSQIEIRDPKEMNL